MFIISSIIVIVVLAVIANAAYFSICRKYSCEEVMRPELTSDELLQRAYRTAYFAHVSMSGELLKNE
jgi:hypothetical protein